VIGQNAKMPKCIRPKGFLNSSKPGLQLFSSKIQFFPFLFKLLEMRILKLRILKLRLSSSKSFSKTVTENGLKTYQPHLTMHFCGATFGSKHNKKNLELVGNHTMIRPNMNRYFNLSFFRNFLFSF
jgi:hypothetical protein